MTISFPPTPSGGSIEFPLTLHRDSKPQTTDWWWRCSTTRASLPCPWWLYHQHKWPIEYNVIYLTESHTKVLNDHVGTYQIMFEEIVSNHIGIDATDVQYHNHYTLLEYKFKRLLHIYIILKITWRKHLWCPTDIQVIKRSIKNNNYG